MAGMQYSWSVAWVQSASIIIMHMEINAALYMHALIAYIQIEVHTFIHSFFSPSELYKNWIYCYNTSCESISNGIIYLAYKMRARCVDLTSKACGWRHASGTQIYTEN